MVHMADRFVTDGARDLRAWLDEQGIGIPKFCEMHGFDRIDVQRIMKGERQRISVNFAFDVEDATEGAVTARRWAQSRAVMTKLRNRRRNRGNSKAA